MPIRIVFMGTPDFSVPALRNLADETDFQIVLVVTQPDRPKGRGKKMTASPVKKAAINLGLDIYQPESINHQEAIDRLAGLAPDFFVVTAFGQILSSKILEIPKFYPINIHASLLPKYRGASPIQAAILNLDSITGVTTMVMTEKMDAGDILLSDKTPVKETDTAQSLHDRLGMMGGRLIVKTIRQILNHELTPVPQDHSCATYVKLLKKSDGKIDWQKTSREIQAHINAMTPWPGAFTMHNKKRMKIFKAHALETSDLNQPGTIIQCDTSGIHVSCGSGILVITELMGTSGKRLTAGQYLCGHCLETFSKFDT